MSDNIWTNEFNPFNKYKLLCWYDRMLRIKTGAFMAPVNIALDLVQGTQEKKKCGGIKCNFCMSDFEDLGTESQIPSDVLFQLPEFYRRWGVTSLCLAGHHSDPLTYNSLNFVKFLRLLYKNDIEVGINTSGLMLNDYLIPDIARNCKWTGFSVNAGRASTFAATTNTKEAFFDKIILNIQKLTEYCKKFNLNHPVCYKYLITDENYTEIEDAVKLAKQIGCRHVQIRPSELPKERSARIIPQIVEDQIRSSLKHEVPDEFEIFGIREKFTNNFTKMPPNRCIASPLGSTWKADGDIVICPDRRWSAHQEGMVMGNFIKEGLEAIRRKWGGPEHRKMIEVANEKLGECIRCTAFQWHNLYENTVASDPMDIRLI